MIAKQKGNTESLQLQPDWTIEADGYGLLTSRLTFRCSAKAAANSKPKTLDTHPEDGRLKCHRSTYTIIKGEAAIIVAEYVGIESGDFTKTQYRGESVTGTQPIQAHKDFNLILKNLGWDVDTQSFPETSATAVTNALVGVRAFLSVDTQISATNYTTSTKIVQDGLNIVGKTFAKFPALQEVMLPNENTQRLSKFHDRIALLSGFSYEKFAHLYKINYTVRISPGGFHSKVYVKYN